MASSSSASSLFATECLLYSTASSSSLVGSMGLTTVANPSSTSPLLTFKGVSDPSFHSLSAIPTSPNRTISGSGGLVFQLENNKATLNVYSFQRDHPLQRIILPSKLSCIASSPSGELIAAGSFEGRIFVWQVATGDLLASFDAHYRSVTVLKWTMDGAGLVTGSEDSRILVWSLAGLLAPHDQTSSSITSSEHNPTPYCTLADHNLAITDLHISSGHFPHQVTILSSSADMSVKLWDLRTRSLLSTFIFEQPIHRVVQDCTERFFFAATSPGSSDHLIYRIDLFRKKDASSRMVETKSSTSGSQYSFVTEELRGATSIEAYGFSSGSGPTNERIPSIADPAARAAAVGSSIITIREPISSICLSSNSTSLLVGSLAGSLFVIDVSNSQILRTVSLLGNAKASAITGKNAVTNLVVLPKPRDLFGHWETGTFSSGAGTSTNGAGGAGSAAGSGIIPVRPVANFSRQLSAAEEDRLVTPYSTRIGASGTRLFPESEVVDEFIDPVWDSNLVSDDLMGSFGALSGAAGAHASGVKTKVQDSQETQRLNKENTLLRVQLQQAKKINDEMWMRLVQDRLSSSQVNVGVSE
ncbi:related to WD-repeat protein crb3 [Melanopsichium pennsylvanicum]|uniref:Pre-rRNA-processing protein IPI3 n=2 Tax=Melanopsichium pennsylvanicum TaxID=63383 RepID=A0AAJ4XFP3_9BASI|nr:related to WD-repeat protein crb3 [Melanopsichium pennsylvanicum 4]SNX81624.1 related to WD-repeat protein crb3 [Melanopsichium pennsylvanicum]